MAPEGVPDSFADHVKLMFDLQMLAFRSDVTRVFSFKLGRDGSNRVYKESGSTSPGDTPANFDKFVKAEAVKWGKAVKDSGATVD